MNIEIEHLNGGLSRERWGFFFTLNSLVFDYYVFEERPSMRHKKWQSRALWHRLSNFESNIPQPSIPTEVRRRLEEEICKKVAELVQSM